MSEIEELINQIEELRLKMIDAKDGKSFADQEVVIASQKLDLVLNKYQEMLMKKSEKN